MFRSAITVSLIPEARGGPFVFWEGLAHAFAAAQEMGFDAVEIFPPAADDVALGEIDALMQRHGLAVAALGTGGGWLRHQLTLTSANVATRARAREFIGAMIDCAGTLGAPAIIGSMQGRWDAATPRAQALDLLAEHLIVLSDRALAHGQPLLYEALNRYETNLFNRQEEAADFLEERGLKNVRLLCDLFHMAIEESSPPDVLRALGPRVGHVHFADSNRHAAGFGHTDFAPIAAALHEIGYRGYLSAEILPVPDSRTAAEQTLRAIRHLATPC